MFKKSTSAISSKEAQSKDKDKAATLDRASSHELKAHSTDEETSGGGSVGDRLCERCQKQKARAKVTTPEGTRRLCRK